MTSIVEHRRLQYAGPLLAVGVQTNAKELARIFGKLASEQMPFAFAVALTRCAQDARKSVVGDLDKTFTLRNKRVAGGITINRAEKNDWPNCKAEVGTRDDFIARHALGGIKRPTKGAKNVAIPMKIIKRTGGGAIPGRLKPVAIRDRPTGFVAQTAGGGLVIRERVKGKKQVVHGPVKRGGVANLGGFATFFLLRRRVRIKPTWPFVPQVTNSVRHRYPVHFGKELEAAMKSARAQVGRFTSEQGRAAYVTARKLLGTF